MRDASNTEAVMLGMGILPLAAAASWLLLLREPAPIAASAQAPALATRVEQPTRAARESQRFTGVIVAGAEAELTAEAGGQVVHVFVDAGANVRRGDALLQLDAVALAGTRELAHLEAALDRSAETSARLAFEAARDNAARLALAASAHSERELQTARSDELRARAALDELLAKSAVRRGLQRRELARAQLQTLRAPFDATVSQRWVDVGDIVAPGTELVRIADAERFARFAVPTAELSRLRVGMGVSVSARTQAGSDTAVVVELQPELDAAGSLAFARARLSRASAGELALWPGARVDVTLTNGTP